jgi:hypothetical protein
MTSSPHAPLTTNEEVTLRRVAYGQSDARVMRGHDLVRLHKLLLIEDSKDVPRLPTLSTPSAVSGGLLRSGDASAPVR